MPARLENELRIDSMTQKVLKNMPTYVIEWHTRLKASSKTASSRYDMINKIKKYLESINPKVKEVTVNEINSESVENYFISTETRIDKNGKVVQASDSYRQGVYCALKNFLEFMVDKRYVEKNYILGIDKPSNHDLDRIKENRLRLTRDSFLAVLKEVKKESNLMLRYRDEALLRIFFETGMRETALMILNISDINFKKKELMTIDKGKGGKPQKYNISDATVDALNRWIKLRAHKFGLESEALFISQHKQRISIKGIYKIVDKYFYRAIGEHVSPHKIRAGLASILYEQTGDIEFVRRAIGQARTETTQRYIVTPNKERETAIQLLAI